MKITKRSTLAAIASFVFGSWFTPRLSGGQANSPQEKPPASALLEDPQSRFGDRSSLENLTRSQQVEQIIADEG